MSTLADTPMPAAHPEAYALELQVQAVLAYVRTGTDWLQAQHGVPAIQMVVNGRR